MSSLFITVWVDAEEVALGQPVQEEVVSFTGTPGESNPIDGSNRLRRRVRLLSDAACFATWGDGLTAAADGSEGRAMGSEAAEYFDIEAGHTISVIAR